MLTRRATVLGSVALCFVPSSAALKDKDKSKPPDLTILEIRAERNSEGIVIEGKLKNPSMKPWVRIQLLIDLLGPNANLLVSRRGPIESDSLEPEGESDFRLQMPDTPKATQIRVNAEDRSGRDLLIGNSGPFPIQ